MGTMKLPGLSSVISNISPAKCSVRDNGVVAGYAVVTNQGLVKTYNEDRVSIVSNIVKPMSRKEEQWPSCSYFGIFDGHSGPGCADYLRDNLHQFVIKEPTFPWNPREALKRGFENAEKRFLEMTQKDGKIVDKSGSCAIVVLIIGNICYIANVGDSRAVLSG
jgi:protein phosphatase 2C family protein 2/3